MSKVASKAAMLVSEQEKLVQRIDASEQHMKQMLEKVQDQMQSSEVQAQRLHREVAAASQAAADDMKAASATLAAHARDHDHIVFAVPALEQKVQQMNGQMHEHRTSTEQKLQQLNQLFQELREVSEKKWQGLGQQLKEREKISEQGMQQLCGELTALKLSVADKAEVASTLAAGHAREQQHLMQRMNACEQQWQQLQQSCQEDHDAAERLVQQLHGELAAGKLAAADEAKVASAALVKDHNQQTIQLMQTKEQQMQHAQQKILQQVEQQQRASEQEQEKIRQLLQDQLKSFNTQAQKWHGDLTAFGNSVRDEVQVASAAVAVQAKESQHLMLRIGAAEKQLQQVQPQIQQQVERIQSAAELQIQQMQTDIQDALRASQYQAQHVRETLSLLRQSAAEETKVASEAAKVQTREHQHVMQRMYAAEQEIFQMQQQLKHHSSQAQVHQQWQQKRAPFKDPLQFSEQRSEQQAEAGREESITSSRQTLEEWSFAPMTMVTPGSEHHQLSKRMPTPEQQVEHVQKMRQNMKEQLLATELQVRNMQQHLKLQTQEQLRASDKQVQQWRGKLGGSALATEEVAMQSAASVALRAIVETPPRSSGTVARSLSRTTSPTRLLRSPPRQ
eukprot:gnl/TRDRNA2_/TRDRNA2_72112_c2_seq1.p1 gnl/TRDRNA2_/TRDRNA2_72112_c2~~gnl/TRDRNA2_/TRDRNA2_72112_c2_seq1.p1  ORF type:complete len:645 (+),score=192.85 gnl/TRDRNA2_/TRDRNA2_72112_c2_seq1:78-1937(+)